MSGLEGMSFRGQFRSYQKRVLDHADAYLKDGRIHIVAAPGSGKTVLGLELIRRIGRPCIILSPTTAIRGQWGERLRDLFLEDGAQFSAVYSADLHRVRPVTSITYQALYTAIERVPAQGEVDCSDIDILRLLREQGIGTVCLDEAHHLRSEWQRALEKFLGMLGEDCKRIALTATPPYDAEGAEWERYICVCGPIDEEIFVPELVAEGTLCPHQDYIYFNYPTQTEAEALSAYRKNAEAAVGRICALEMMKPLCERLQRACDREEMFSRAGDYIALFSLFRQGGCTVSRRTVRMLTARRGLPALSPQTAERAINFLLDGGPTAQEEREQILAILKECGVCERKKARLVLNERLRRMLVSSVGKLDSIVRIARAERGSLGEELRMLVLTDYIRRESVDRIATQHAFSSVNVVSIFEMLRRTEDRADLGVLSGSLVILPERIDLSAVGHTEQKIEGAQYKIVVFAGGAGQAVKFVGDLFARGEIRILVGTKSLLGEGWDAPCINTLVLASFVGSFVLSNQMRGRAIRVDRSHPAKTANIWHLVTAEPAHIVREHAAERAHARLRASAQTLDSWDFSVLRRRFDTFMGPNYSTGAIESGIERITDIAPPFDKDGIARINAAMLARAADRDALRKQWTNEVKEGKFTVVAQSEIPREKRVPVFVFRHIAPLLFLLAMEGVLIGLFARSVIPFSFPVVLAVVCAEGVALYALYRLLRVMVMHFDPARSVRTLGNVVFQTLAECGVLSGAAKVECVQDRECGMVALSLRNASLHDQNIFNTAMAEFLSPIENPRYILIKRNALGGYCYRQSYACPSAIGRKQEFAAVLARKLRADTGRFALVYTRNEGGRAFILKCRRRSYITADRRMIDRKYKVSHWE